MIAAMDEDLSVDLDSSRTLWLTEISRQTFFDQSLESLESDCGLFVVLEDTTTGAFEVLAKAASPMMGQLLLELFASRMGPRTV